MDDNANIAARSARWLVKTSRADTSLAFLVATLGLGAGWIGFTSWGVLTAVPSSGRGPFALVADIAYACLTFLSPTDAFIHAGRLSLPLELGRNCALGLTLLGVIKLLQRLSGPFVARVLMRTAASGHAIVASIDGSGDAIAIATSEGGIPTALADPTLAKDGERMELLGREGVVAVRGKSLVDMVGRGARMGRAATIAAWNEADTASLGTALELRAKAPLAVPEIAVRIASPLVQRSLRAAPRLLERTRDTGTRLRPVSQIGASCRKALSGTGFVDRARSLGRDRVHALLIGEGAGLQWVAEFLLGQAWSHGLGGPRIDIVGPEIAWRDWRRAHHALLSDAEAVFDPDLVPQVTLHDAGCDLYSILGPHTTAVFVDLADDQHSLALAFELATRTKSDGREIQVRPLLKDHSALIDFVDAADLPLEPPIVHAGAASLPALLERGLDERAARLHLAYMQGVSPSEVGAIDWDDLHETMLHANRSAASHEAIKRGDLARLGNGARAALDGLGRIEHARWSADKLLDGWRPGERDDARLRHPDLVPWATLDRTTKDKDLAEYLTILAENNSPKTG